LRFTAHLGRPTDFRQQVQALIRRSQINSAGSIGACNTVLKITRGNLKT